jgi:transposase
MVRTVGLDLHKEVAEWCFVDEEGKVLGRERVEVSPETLEAFAKKHLRKTDRVALEATTNTWAVVRLLKPHVAEVKVSNPYKARVIAEANVKTDKVDAEVLAQLLRMNWLPLVWEPDEKTSDMRALSARRVQLVRDRTRVRNRIRSILAQRLIRPDVEPLFGKKGIACLKELTLDAPGKATIESELRLHELIEQEIAATTKQMAQEGFGDARVKLLMTLPGIDLIVAEGVMAAIGDIKRFSSADRLASYLGLCPRTKQSAHSCHHGPITKAGNTMARWLLVEAAHHHQANPGPLGHFFRKIAKKKGANVAATAGARKLATIIWHMLTNNQPYRYALPRTTETKLRSLRIKGGGGKRTSGPRKGATPTKKSGKGEPPRREKPLREVYELESLPPLPATKEAELRMLTKKGLLGFMKAVVSGEVSAPSQR